MTQSSRRTPDPEGRKLVQGMSKPNTVIEILATLKAKTTPNKYIREHNDEYWADINQAAHSLNELYLNKYLSLVGEDEPTDTDDPRVFSWTRQEYNLNINNYKAELREEARKAFKGEKTL